MKKNSFLNKVVITSLAVILLAVPTLSFADVNADKAIGMDKRGERIESAALKFDEKIADALGKKDAYREKMTVLIGDFAPELQGEFDALWDTHDSLHTGLVAERTRILEEKQTETKALFDEVKAAVAAGDMTREEAKLELTGHREALQADKAATQAELDEIKATYDVPEGTIRVINDAIKAAVESGDVAAVKAGLTDLLNSLAKHLTFDQAKLDFFQTK